MKITCECLTVKNQETGALEPLVIDCPDSDATTIKQIQDAGFEAGARMRLGLASDDVFQKFSDTLAAKVIDADFKMTRELFLEIWDVTLGPAIDAGDITWECSETLAGHLKNAAAGNLDEVCGQIPTEKS